MSEPRPDPDLRLLSGVYRDLQSPGSEACPPAEALAALAVGERGPESERVADHALSCRRCTDDLQLLLRTRAEMSGGRLEPRRARPWLVAAAAAAALVLGFLLVRRLPAPVSKMAGVERGLADEGGRVTPRSGSELASAPEGFAWPAEADAAGYRVRLFDASGAEVWRSERIKEPRAQLPPAERDNLHGGAYFWRVDVDGAPEKKLLGPFTFRLVVH